MSKKSIEKQLIDYLKEPSTIDVPYHVWRFIGDETKQISLAGDQASLGLDYGSLQELRNAIAWYVEQLGGQVKWEK